MVHLLKWKHFNCPGNQKENAQETRKKFLHFFFSVLVYYVTCLYLPSMFRRQFQKWVSCNPKCENDCFNTPWKALEEKLVHRVSVCLNIELRKCFMWADEVAPRVEGLAMQASLMTWIPSPEPVMSKATHFTKLPSDPSCPKLVCTHARTYTLINNTF